MAGSGRVRARTQSMSRLSKRFLEAEALHYPPAINDANPRPALSECDATDLGTSENPCPFIRCPNHLYLDVNPATGSVKINFPDVPPESLDLLPATCARVIAREAATATSGQVALERIALVMNLSRERVRQVEAAAFRKILVGMRRAADDAGMDDLVRKIDKAILLLGRDKCGRRTREALAAQEGASRDQSYIDDALALLAGVIREALR
ncbi:MAG: hypothetical protein JNK72_24960 [Myxococcales bacterium]|nr:hypothetical protein [Myxococcales bacterium]